MNLKTLIAPILVLVAGFLFSVYIRWRLPESRSASWQRWMPAGIYILFIFLMSSRSFADAQLPFSANYFHPMEYAVLAIFFSWAWYPVLLQSALLPFSLRVVVSGTFYGVLDELHQSFVPGRTTSLLDLGLDFFGICVGLGIFLLVRKSGQVLQSRVADR